MMLEVLGGSREIGRSCFLVSTEHEEKGVMLDSGVSLGGGDKFPEEPEKDPEFLVLSHAHLDHSGYVPFIMKKYEGCKFVSTAPTQDISEILQNDYIKVGRSRGDEEVYSYKDVLSVRKRSTNVPYRVNLSLGSDTSIVLFRAGHIIGSSMVYLKDGNKTLLYTGDFCTQNTRALDIVDIDIPRVRNLIIESTYGSPEDMHPSREKVEKSFIENIRRTYERGGKAIIPVFAVGRAQEVMLTIEAYMRSRALPKMPVYIDGLVKKVNTKYRLFWEWLTVRIQRQIRYTNKSPLESNIFFEVKRRLPVRYEGPCIILSTSGMLQGGPVLYYLKKLAGDEKNSIIFTGYQVEGTRGRKLLEGNREIEIDGEKVKVNAEVSWFDFSAHADFNGLMRFLSLFKELENVVIVHGEERKSKEMAKRIEMKRDGVNVYVPKVGDSITI
ncbi:MAG: MBL fold metallo-hydrolase RNA specificity domain-containing protein [Candidatus Asgardarchaeia archaeon]